MAAAHQQPPPPAERERVVVVVQQQPAGQQQAPMAAPADAAAPPPPPPPPDNRGMKYGTAAALVAIGIGVGCFGAYRYDKEESALASYEVSMSVWRYYYRICFIGICAEHSVTDINEMEPCAARRNFLLAGRIAGVVAFIGSLCMLGLGAYHRVSSGGSVLTQRAPLNGLASFVGGLIVVCCIVTGALFYGQCDPDGDGGGGSTPAPPDGGLTGGDSSFGVSPFGYGGAVIVFFVCIYANNTAPPEEQPVDAAGDQAVEATPVPAEGVVVNDGAATTTGGDTPYATTPASPQRSDSSVAHNRSASSGSYGAPPLKRTYSAPQ